MNSKERVLKRHCLPTFIAFMIAIIVFFLLNLLGYEVGTLGQIAPYGLFLLCPLLHIGMMMFMFKDKNHNCNHEKKI